MEKWPILSDAVKCVCNIQYLIGHYGLGIEAPEER